MDATKGVDRTNMSLDDIIKLDRQSIKKVPTFKNSKPFVKNTVFRGRPSTFNTISHAPFNRDRLGVANKRNFIKTNIVINKRNNLNSRLNVVVPRINESNNISLNYKSKSYNPRDILNNVPAIRITAPNDQHQTSNRNNSERRPINRNVNDIFPVKSFTSKSFRDKNRPTNENIRDRRSLNQNSSDIRSNNLWIKEDRLLDHSRRTDNQRKSFNDIRHDISQINNSRNYVSQKDEFKRSQIHSSRDYSTLHRSKNYSEEYRRSEKGGLHRNVDRSNDREYEAMARALIEAHKDSRHKSYQSRYNNDREYSYRR